MQYKYVTYSERYDNVYGCQFDLTEGANKLHYQPLADGVVTKDFYRDGEKCTWTDKVVVFCPLPSGLKSMTEGVDYEITGYTLQTPDDTEKLFEESLRTDGIYEKNSYAAVVRFPDYDFQIFKVIPNYSWIIDGDKVPGRSEPAESRFSYTFPVPVPDKAEFTTRPADDVRDGIVVSVNGESVSVDNDYEHTLSATVPMTSMNIDPDIRAAVYNLLTTDVETVVNGVTDSYIMKVGTVGSLQNAIVLDNLDPNDWFVSGEDKVTARSGNMLRVRSQFSNNVKGYPEDMVWEYVDMQPEQTISAPNISKPHVYRVNVPVEGKKGWWTQKLMLASMPVEDVEQTMAGAALVNHDAQHLAIKVAGQPVSAADSQLHRKSDIISDNSNCLLEESNEVTWFNEIGETPLTALEQKGSVDFQAAYVYFFTSGKDVKGNGALTVTPAAAPASYAAAAAPATHYSFVTPYGSTTYNMGDVLTSVDGIQADAPAVKAGRGWIEITGENVTVSTVSGMPVASSAGRYDVAPGIYVAKAGGIPFKVIVK